MPGVGIYRFVLSGSLVGQFVENVMYFSATTAPGTPTETAFDLLDAFHSTLLPGYLSVIPTLFTGLGYSAEPVTPAGGPRVFSNTDYGGVNGDRAGGIVDSSTSAVMIASASTGPTNITGKIFLPGVTVLDLSNNVYDAGFQTTVDAFATSLLADVMGGASTFRYGVFSKASNGISLPSIIQLSLNPGTQRRRMRPLI